MSGYPLGLEVQMADLSDPVFNPLVKLSDLSGEAGSAVGAYGVLSGARLPLADPSRAHDRWEWVYDGAYVRRPGRTGLDWGAPVSWPKGLALDLRDPATWPVVDRRLLEAYVQQPNTGIPTYVRIVPMCLEDARLFAEWAFMVVNDTGADFIRIGKGRAATGLEPSPANLPAFRAALVRAFLCTPDR